MPPQPREWLPTKKIAPPKPLPGRAWSAWAKAEQNAEYVRALRAYTYEGGTNPQTRGAYYRTRETTKAAG